MLWSIHRLSAKGLWEQSSQVRNWSKKRSKRNAEAKVVRDAMVREALAVGGCEICGHSQRRPNRKFMASLSQLCVHEIANGPLREKAQDKRYATLVVCWRCNEALNDKGADGWPEARQLAVLAMVRPMDFDLRAYNELVNPRAPRRITLFEVFDEMSVAKEKQSVSDRLLLVDEVAHIMQCDRKTVRRWIHAGWLRAINVAPPGSTKCHFRVDAADLKKFAASRQTMSDEDFEQILGEVQENWL